MKLETLALAIALAAPGIASATDVYICRAPTGVSMQDVPCRDLAGQLSHMPDYNPAVNVFASTLEQDEELIRAERGRKEVQRERAREAARMQPRRTSLWAEGIRARELRMEQRRTTRRLENVGDYGAGNYARARAYGDLLNNQQIERSRLTR